MKQGLLWRILLAVCVLVLMVACLLPTFLLPPPGSPGSGGQPSGLARLLPDARVNLGLDLMGGIHLTLGVQVDKAIETSFIQMGQSLLQDANSNGFLMTRPSLLPGEKLEFMFASPAKEAEFKEFLAKSYAEFRVDGTQPAAEGRVKYTVSLDPAVRARLAEMTLDQALATIRNRIDQFGVAEPDVRKQQDNRIAIQLPGMSDPERAVDIIGKTAHLEFRLVRDDVNPKSKVLPRGVIVLPMERKSRTGQEQEEYIAVEEQVVLTGERTSHAGPALGPGPSTTSNRAGEREG